jgi:outer membrane receptor protein involved in Fe transport
VYGADAVAGVVNFLMDTEFTGIRLDGTYSWYQHNNRCPSISNPNQPGATVCDVLQERIDAGLNGYSFPRGSVADGGAFDGTVSLGAKFDDGRGHAMAYFGYRKVKPILQARRDFSACALNGTSTNPVSCGGSSTNATGTAIIFTPTGSQTRLGLHPGSIGARGPAFNFNPYNYFQRPDERYIGGAFANYEVADEIKPYLEFMFMDDHTLAQIAPSGDFGNTLVINCDNPLLSDVAGSGATTANPTQTERQRICAPENLIVGSAGGFPVAASAPFGPGLGFPAGSPPQTFFGPTGQTYNNAFFQLLRRNVEGGPRISDLTHTNFRGVVGTRGDLSNVWSYDTYFQYGRTNYSQVYRNEFSTARLINALNVVSVLNGQEVPVGTPGSVPTCRSVLAGTDVNCVPFDIFTGNGPSAAALNYLNVFGVIEGKTNEQVANLNFTGALGEMGIQTPWSDEGIGVNVGTEYRKESLTLNPDQSFQAGDLTGQGAPTLPVNGAFRVLELFAETQIPIVRNSFIDELSLAAGYRKSWYRTEPGEGLVDNVGNPVVSREYDTDTYKLSAEFAPVKDIRFRGAYNRAVRAPNIQELFAPTFVGLDASRDPCAGFDITAADQGCIAQGLPIGSNTPSNPANQYNGLLGGNPTLNPEKATTKTLGAVLQPRFLPRFAATIDYYDIEIKGAIQGFGADAILSNCVENTTDAANPAPSCALIHRDPAGSIWLTSQGFVIDTPANVGGVQTKGFDGTATYSHRLGGIGNLSASFIGTLLRHYVVDDGLNPVYDCAGFYGATCGSPLPKWRHKLRTTLQMPNGIGVSLQWRYVGKVTHEGLNESTTLSGAGTPPIAQHVKAQNYFDLAGTFDIGDHYALRLGVNNILDREPPIFTSGNGACAVATCNGNTYGGAYDALGRYIYAGATLNF